MPATADSLSLTFAALADPTRRALLARLATSEAVVKELAEPFEMSSPAVSKHLRVLERAGLVEQARDRQWRPRRLRAAPLAEAADWLQAYRPFWEERLDRMEAVVRNLKASQPAMAPRPSKASRRRKTEPPKASRPPRRGR